MSGILFIGSVFLGTALGFIGSIFWWITGALIVLGVFWAIDATAILVLLTIGVYNGALILGVLLRVAAARRRAEKSNADDTSAKSR